MDLFVKNMLSYKDRFFSFAYYIYADIFRCILPAFWDLKW